MYSPPYNPDIRVRIKQRLMDMSPRAFELFAGDLLVYVGLQNIVVTRYVSDGGIDAFGDLISSSELMRVTAGVQVKRHQQNVQRADIDRFIGALGGQYHHGLFITTAGYAPNAKVKATASPLIDISTIDGSQIADLMIRHRLGLLPENASTTDTTLDEQYFVDFEDQPPSRFRESREPYNLPSDPVSAPVQPENDLITLRALSYILRIDTTTLRNWIERGTLTPDRYATNPGQGGLFFRRDRINDIRQNFGIQSDPVTSSEWRQEFIDFVRSRQLTKSYKPVFLKALLKVIDRNGNAQMADVIQEFHQYYIEREHQSLPLEYGESLFKNGANVPVSAIKNLIIKNPLDRFIIKGFLEYDRQSDTIHFAAQLWHELRFYELLDILTSADEQLRYYYNRR